jgi:hypothetical protein
VTDRRRRRRKQLLDVLKETRGYWKLKKEEPYRTLWKTLFRRGVYNLKWRHLALHATCTDHRSPLDLVTTIVEYKLPLRNFLRLKDTAGNILDTKQVWLRHLDSHPYKTARKNRISFPFYIIISRATRSSQLQLFSHPQFWFLRRCYLNTIATLSEGTSTQDHTRRRQTINWNIPILWFDTTELYICIKTCNKDGNNTLNIKWPEGRNENTPRATLLQKKAKHHASSYTFSPPPPHPKKTIIISWYMVTSCTNPF